VVQQLRERIDKWDSMTKEMVTRLKKQPTELEKIFASCTSDKELISRIYREFKKFKLP
jgi:hypothetical protein